MKNIKRIISVFMCLVLSVGLLSACGDDESQKSYDKIKIGVSIWSLTDSLGAQCKRVLDRVQEALGDVEIVYEVTGHVSEKVKASVEKLASDGCSGIILCNSSDSEMISAINTCDDSEVYLAQFFRIISKDDSSDIYDQAVQSPYYIGAVHEDEIENGQKLCNILLDKGCRRIGVIGWEQGDATWLGRWHGYSNAVDVWNSEHHDDLASIIYPVYAGTTVEGGIKAANKLMMENSDIDAIIPAGGGGDPLKGALSAIEDAGKVGDIKVVSTDFCEDLQTRLKNGSITAESGGHYCDCLFAFMMVYNAVKGNYRGFEGKLTEILYPYLFVDSPDDYGEYEKYYVKQLPYSDDEIKEIAGLDLDGLVQKASSVSIEDAAARFGN